jgi:hypothetical protein
MIDALRPSTLGEILDRTAHLYRSRFLVFFGIAVIPAGTVLACAASVFLFFTWIGAAGVALGPATVGVLSMVLLGVCTLIILPLWAAATGLGSGALNHAADAAFLNQRITIRDAYRDAWKRGWQYIWLGVLRALILIVAPAVFYTVLILLLAVVDVTGKKSVTGASDGAVLLILMTLAALVAYAVWMLLRLCLAFPACVVERIGAWTALKRAFSLSAGTRGRILVLYLLGAVLGWILAMAFTIPVIIIVSLIPALNTPQHSPVLGMVFLLTAYGAWFAVQAFTKPVYAIAFMVFYYDQRIRREGFDIEWMMRQAGMVPARAAEPQAAPGLPASVPTSAGTSSPPAESGLAEARDVPAAVESALSIATDLPAIVESVDAPRRVQVNAQALEEARGEPA